MFSRKGLIKYIVDKYQQLAQDMKPKTSLELELQITILHWTHCKKKVSTCESCINANQIQSLITSTARQMMKDDI